MQKVIIQNEAVNAVIDKDVQACVQQIFAKVVGLNNFDKIADDIAKSAIVALTEKSFMTTDLELTDKQKETLSEGMSDLVKKSVQTYVAGIKKDERTKTTISIVEECCRRIISRVLFDIGQEINRGCIINSQAVKADAKNENFNTIELRHAKDSGDITVPTKGIFVASNCVDLIVNSIKIETPKAGDEE